MERVYLARAAQSKTDLSAGGTDSSHRIRRCQYDHTGHFGEPVRFSFCAETKESGIQIKNFQFDRYCSVLSGLEKMLAAKNARLQIVYRQGIRASTADRSWSAPFR